MLWAQLGHIDERLVDPLTNALEAELTAAEPTTCVLGPVTRRLGGQWLGVPVSGLDDLAATVFDATIALVPVTHPQPFQADIVVARGRVPAALAGDAVEGEWSPRPSRWLPTALRPGNRDSTTSPSSS